MKACYLRCWEYLSKSENIELIICPVVTCYSYYSYMIKTPKGRRGIMEYMGKKGIKTSILLHPVHLQPVYRELFSFKSGDLQKTEEACLSILSLSIYHGLPFEDIVFISTKLSTALSHNL